MRCLLVLPLARSSPRHHRRHHHRHRRHGSRQNRRRCSWWHRHGRTPEWMSKWTRIARCLKGQMDINHQVTCLTAVLDWAILFQPSSTLTGVKIFLHCHQQNFNHPSVILYLLRHSPDQRISSVASCCQTHAAKQRSVALRWDKTWMLNSGGKSVKLGTRPRNPCKYSRSCRCFLNTRPATATAEELCVKRGRRYDNAS